jgi:hypothetical protein
MSNPKFKVGDIVISKYGTKPFRVRKTEWGGLYGTYLHNEKACCFDVENVILYNEPEELTPMPNLYQFKNAEGTVIYGTYLATNQLGQWVMEEKGNGALHTVDQKETEEVLPYTFSVKVKGTVKHYIGSPNQLSVGDTLICVMGDYPELAVVTALNTKNKEARAKFSGRKIVTEALPEQP